MTFREKSAWVMMVALLIAGVFYMRAFMFIEPVLLEETTIPLVPVFGIYVVIVTVLAIVGHIIVAVINPGEANTDQDERDRLISVKAGSMSGYVLGAGIVLSLMGYLWEHEGVWLFHTVFLSLMVSQFAEYAIRVFCYRRGY